MTLSKVVGDLQLGDQKVTFPHHPCIGLGYINTHLAYFMVNVGKYTIHGLSGIESAGSGAFQCFVVPSPHHHPDGDVRFDKAI